MQLTPSGNFLYVTASGGQAGSNNGSIIGFSVNAGALQLLTPPLTDADGVNPNGLAIDPKGAYLYVANTASSSISIFAIGASGALSEVQRFSTRRYLHGSGFADSGCQRSVSLRGESGLQQRCGLFDKFHHGTSYEFLTVPQPRASSSPRVVQVSWRRTRAGNIYLWRTRAALRGFSRLALVVAI